MDGLIGVGTTMAVILLRREVTVSFGTVFVFAVGSCSFVHV